jgi:hypothetical protein
VPRSESFTLEDHFEKEFKGGHLSQSMQEPSQPTAWRRPSVIIFEKISNYMNRVEETHPQRPEETKQYSEKPAFIVKHLITSVDCFVERLKSVQFIGKVLKVKSGDCGLPKLLKDF